MSKISLYQLFAVTALFQLGTTIIFGFGSDAGRDAWISFLLSTGLGTVLIVLYIVLMRMQPGLSLVQSFPAQLGRWLGTPIAWLYPLVFLYDSGRVMGDLEGLIPLTVLPGTPNWVILGSFMAVIMYVLFSGIEVICRLAGMILPFLFLFFMLEIVLLVSSGSLHASYMQPILGEGWGRVWKAVWPLGITQTYGESILFAMLWPMVIKQNKIIKISALSSISVGLLMAVFQLIAILVLGESIFQRETYPLFELLRQVSIADFIENLDAFGIMYFVITSFFKMSLQIYTAVLAIQQLTYVRDNRLIIVATSIIVLFLGMTMAKNVTEHIAVGTQILPYNVWMHLFIVLPCILLLVAWVRQKRIKKGDIAK